MFQVVKLARVPSSYLRAEEFKGNVWVVIGYEFGWLIGSFALQALA